MTGKLARLMVGTCMTAALTVGGITSSLPAAHAGGSPCIGIGVNVVQCVSLPVTITVGNINVVTVENVLNNNWISIPIASNDPVLIATSVKDVLNNNNVLSCLINVTVAGVGNKTDNC